jgi:hypothetical protein
MREGNRPPEARILRLVAIVAHREEVPGLDGDRTETVAPEEGRGRPRSVGRGIAMSDVWFDGLQPVHPQGFRLSLDLVPGHGDGALDEIAAGIARVPEDDHVTAREIAVRQDFLPRTPMSSVRKLVHEHIVAGEDRVLHRGARHVEDLEDEAFEDEGEGGSHEDGLDRVREAPRGRHHSTLRTARKASWGSSTRPTFFMRRLPSFCFSRSFFLRVMSPP